MKRYRIKAVWVVSLFLILAILSNTKAQTVDLATHQSTDTPPVGATFEWHNALPASAANLMTPAQIAAASSGLYYGVYNLGTCYTAPSALRVGAITAPATTADLKTFVDSTAKSAGMVTSYHTGSPATSANKITDLAASTAPAGTYFVAYYDPTSMCYTQTSPIVLTGFSCLAGTTPPSVSATSLSNTCPSATVNLNSLVTSTAPSGTRLRWHTVATNPTAADSVATPLVLATAGTYYAYYFDAANDCYSPATAAVTVTFTTCAPIINCVTDLDVPATNVANAISSVTGRTQTGTTFTITRIDGSGTPITFRTAGPNAADPVYKNTDQSTSWTTGGTNPLFTASPEFIRFDSRDNAANGAEQPYRLQITFNQPVTNPIINISGTANRTITANMPAVLLASHLYLNGSQGGNGGTLPLPTATPITNGVSLSGSHGSDAFNTALVLNGTFTTAIIELTQLTNVSTWTNSVGASIWSQIDNMGLTVSGACCQSGTTAPTLSGTTLTNTCPATTVNLNSLHTGTIPNGARLRWHTVATNPTATDSVATPSVLAASGTYYAYYFDAVNNCYSPATAAVTVTLSTCYGLVDDIKTTSLNTPITYDPLVNDNLPVGTTLSFVNGTELFPGTPTTGIVVPNGIVDVSADGKITFKPNLGFTGTTTFTYSVSSPILSLTANNTITIIVAVTDNYTTTGTTPVTLTPLTGDTPGTTIKSINGVNLTSGTAQIIPTTNGTVNITATGVITFTSNTGFTGTETFPYVIQDASGVTATANQQINVLCPAGTTAPSVSATTLSNTCPATTVNLNSLHTGTIPSGARLRWHRVATNPTAADSVATPSVLATVGTYYAYYFDAVSNCYSPATAAVTVTINNCLDSDGDGIPDYVDLDDDNDGVRDTDECAATFKFAPFTMAANTSVGTAAYPSGGTIGVNLLHTYTKGGAPATYVHAGGYPAVGTGPHYQDKLVNDAALLKEVGTITGANAALYTWSNFGEGGDFRQKIEFNFATTTRGYANDRTVIGFSGNYPDVPGFYDDELIFTAIKMDGSVETDYSGWRFMQPTNPTQIAAGNPGAFNEGNTPYDGIANTQGNFTVDLGNLPEASYTGGNDATTGFVFIPAGKRYQKVYFERHLLASWNTYMPANYSATEWEYSSLMIGEKGAVCDTDNDGIANSLDLDSDGDGCSDAFEAGATTDKTTNFQFPTTGVGTNGLTDSKETIADNGVINYTSTYTTYAKNGSLNLCTDSDNDGIPDVIDIDDDNDGVLDTQECAPCTSDPFANGGFELPNINAAPYNSSTFAAINQASISGWQTTATDGMIEVWRSGFNVGFGPVPSAEGNQFVELNANQVSTLYQTFCLNGAPGTVNWSVKHRGRTGTDVAALKIGATLATATTIRTLSDGNSAWGAYSGTYTIPAGLTTLVIAFEAVSTANGDPATGNFIDDVQITINQGCPDTDMDGVANSLDLDSDGDGCSDAFEAGATTSKTANYQFTGAVGTNGLVDTKETATDNGTLNYTSTYVTYATAGGLNLCTDTDNDGIPNVIDLDDDNDGVLDIVEDACPTPENTYEFGGTFGSVTGSVRNLQTPITGAYNYGGTGTGALNPSGTYVVASYATSRNIHTASDLWDNIYGHTTGTTDDAYLAVNGSASQGVFYTQNLSLLANQDYFVSMWAIAAAINPTYNGTPANLQVRVTRTSDNVVVASFSTGNMYPTRLTAGSDVTPEYWKQASGGFNTSGATAFRLDVLNNTLSSSDNDFAIDDVVIKAIGCAGGNIDIDGDGIVNSLDLDSDGDGCSDAYEAGATTSKTVNYQFAAATVGTNGLSSSVENNDSQTATTTYTATYNEALNNTIIACCEAGTVAPALSATTKQSNCGATTADLSTITASNKPAATVMMWHTATPATYANRVTDSTAVTAGTYYAAFYDANLKCFSTATTAVTVTLRTIPATPTTTVTQPTCSVTTGTITVNTPTSGVTYSFDNGTTYQASNIKSGLTAATTYQVIVKDDVSACVSTATPSVINAVLAVPSAPTTTVTQPTCSVTTGSIEVTAPTSGVTYSFDNGTTYQASNIKSGLAAATTYQVIVKDDVSACTSTATPSVINVVLAVPSAPTTTVTQPTCGVTTGTITVNTPSSGVTYSFDNGTTYQASNIKSGLAAATTYQVLVKDDASACVSTATPSVINAILAVPSAPTTTVTQPTCSVTTGSIEVTAPTSGVTYSFDNGATYQASNIKSGLAAATTYQVIVKDDASACVSTATPSVINAVLAVPNAPTTTVTQPTCGVTTGTITVNTPTSGVTYSFDNGATYQASNIKSGLAAATTYQVIVKDNVSACMSTATPSVINTVLAVPSAPTTTVTQPTCSVTTGSIEVTAPTSGVTYSFDNGATYQASNIKSGLAAATTYQVLVKDDVSACVSTATPSVINAVLAVPNAPTTTVTQPTCSVTTGSIEVTAPTSGVTYSFDNGATYQASNIKSGLAAATTYQVIVKDDVSACVSTATPSVINAVLAVPSAPTTTVTQPTCSVTTGSIEVTAPTSGVTYSFDNGTTYQASNIKSGLAAATTYQVIVKDNASACVSTATPSVINAVLGVPSAPTTTVTQPTCSVTTGSIEVTAPTSGVTYSFDNGATYQASNIKSGLAAATTYQVIVKDNTSACVSTATPSVINAVLAVPSAPTTTVTQPTCSVPTGTITVSAPTTGVVYSFDNGATFQALATSSALTSGTYQVVVKDNASACVSTVTSTTVNPQPASPSIINVTKGDPSVLSCPALNNGEVSVTATGTNLEYSKDNGATWQVSNLFTGLTAGSYNIKVRDNVSGCDVTYPANPVVLVAPICNQYPSITSLLTATTPENVSPSTTVYTVTATDPNVGQTLTFSFQTGGADNGKFTIDPTTGEVKFVTSPDFELPTDANGDNIYEIKVKVCDNGTPQYCDLKTVLITVTDLPENITPTITSAATATTPENVSTTTPVYTATATDANSGQTQTFSFETGGADNAKFTIDPVTGAVTFVASPDFETPTDAGGNNVYDIKVKVCDNGTPQLCAVKDVAITVTDIVNECATPSVGGTVAYTGGTVCSTANMGTLTLTGQTGNVLKWQTSTNGGALWTDIAGTLNKTTYNFINAANNQQFRAVVNANIVTCSDVYSSVVTITTSATACTTTTCSYTSSSFSPTITTSSNPNYTTHVVLVNPTTGVMDYVTAANSTAFTGVALGDYVMYAVTYDNTVLPTPTIAVGTNITALAGCTSISDPLLTKVCCPTIAAPTVSITQPTCSVTTGSITVTNPTSGVTYSFDNGATFQASATISGLAASTTYQVLTKDNANACLSTATPSVINAVLTVPSAPIATVVHPTCGVSTGTITVTTPASGVTYSFDNGTTFQALATSNPLATGTYSVKVKDATSGCVSTATPSVINAQPNVPTAPTNVTVVNQPTCATATGSVSMNGLPSTGTWTLTRLNTVTLASVVITNSGSGATFSYGGVPSGTYTYTVTDNASTCTSPASNSITVNAQPVTPSVPTLSVTQPTCTVLTGGITITQPTDVGMTYSIDGTTYTNTTGVFNNVASGTYSVTAKSASGCLSPSASATINTIIPAPTVTIVQPSCTVATGSFTVIDPVGVGFSYSVDLVDYSNTSGVFSGLAPATYNVTAKNASGCVSAATPVVILPPVPAPIIATNQPNCTTATGTITITTPTTGVTYSFDNGLTFQASNILSNATAGTYQIVLKNNADACVTSPKDVIVSPQPTIGCSCGNTTGTITATTSNQNTSAAYTQVYALTDNEGVVLQTSNMPTFTGLASNQYAIYAINYKTTEGVNGLTVGQNVAGVNSPCLDVSAPLFFKVCLPVFACNSVSGNITAQISGQNTGATFTQSYVLTDENGVMLKLSTTPSFTGLIDGKYKMYGVNYETTGGITGLSIGQNISGLTGACLNVSQPLLYQVCLVAEICNNRIDDDGDGLIDCEDVSDCTSCGCDNTTGTITFTNTGQTTTDYTQVYVLTDSTGKILKTNTAATFTGLSSGRYRVYAINYRTADGITGITIGGNISGVTGTCFDKSLPILFKVCLCVTMDIKVMLEGPYVTASSTMQTILNQRGLLPGQTPIGQFAVQTPQGQPYKGAPWFYSGTEGDTITTYPATVVDWVLLSLRSDSTTNANVFRVTGWLHNDGHISFLSPCFDIANGSYFVVIEHRNHVGVMSPNKVPITNGVLTHDFTINDSYVLINPPSFGQKQKGSKWVMYAGDGKKDTQTTNFDVNFQDSQYWKLQSGTFDQYKFGDFNMDADVNFSDNYLWKFNSGKYSAVPH